MDLQSMKPLARDLVSRLQPQEVMPLFCVSQELVNGLAAPTDLARLAAKEKVTEGEGYEKDVHEFIVWAEACTRNPAGIIQNANTNAHLRKLQEQVTAMIIPPRSFCSNSLFDEDHPVQISSLQAFRFRYMATTAFRLLSRLDTLLGNRLPTHPEKTLACLAAYTDPEDPWSNEESSSIAKALLQSYQQSTRHAKLDEESSIGPHLLKHVVRPAFSKRKGASSTRVESKASRLGANAIDHGINESHVKPWKYREPYIVTVFQWSLCQLSKEDIEIHWPLVVPPLLALMDDEGCSTRVKGCKLLIELLKITPSTLLMRTGLGAIFEEALIPMLSSYPPLVSEEDSLQILNNAYPALLTLEHARFPGDIPSADKATSLDRVLRRGIFNGLVNSSDNVKVTNALVNHMTSLVEELSFCTIKHLTHIIPTLVGLLCDPFITAYPPLILSTSRALQGVILACWPRVSVYRGEIFKGVAVCWCRLLADDQSDKRLDTMKHSLAEVLHFLYEAISNEEDATTELTSGLKSDARLHDLWQVVEAKMEKPPHLEIVPLEGSE